MSKMVGLNGVQLYAIHNLLFEENALGRRQEPLFQTKIEVYRAIAAATGHSEKSMRDSVGKIIGTQPTKKEKLDQYGAWVQQRTMDDLRSGVEYQLKERPKFAKETMAKFAKIIAGDKMLADEYRAAARRLLAKAGIDQKSIQAIESTPKGIHIIDNYVTAQSALFNANRHGIPLAVYEIFLPVCERISEEKSWEISNKRFWIGCAASYLKHLGRN